MATTQSTTTTKWTLVPDENCEVASTNMRTRETRFPIGSDITSRATREHELEHIRTSLWPKPTTSPTWDYVEEYRVDTSVRQMDIQLRYAIDKLRRNDIDAWISSGGLNQNSRTHALAAVLGRGYRLRQLIDRPEERAFLLHLLRATRRHPTSEVLKHIEEFDNRWKPLGIF